LNVTPHINAQGDVTVDLIPEISSLLGWDIIDAARGIRAPRFSTRKADTQIMLRDNETIMIGGLISEQTIEFEKKVPILGDIPWLDKIFSKTEDQIDTTELIIFLTVHLLDPDDTVPTGTVSGPLYVPISSAKASD